MNEIKTKINKNLLNDPILTKDQKIKFKKDIVFLWILNVPIIVTFATAIIYLVSIYKTINIIFCAALILIFMTEMIRTTAYVSYQHEIISERIEKRIKKNKKFLDSNGNKIILTPEQEKEYNSETNENE